MVTLPYGQNFERENVTVPPWREADVYKRQMEDIPPEHRIFAYPKLNIREQMAAYQEVIDRSALNEEKQRLPASREDR